MTEKTANIEILPSINGWREVATLPVVAEEKPWNPAELERILVDSIQKVAQQALVDNNGTIYTTLSGGLDSSLCLAIIRNLYPDVPIHTFTVGSSKHPDMQFAKAASFIFQTFHHPFVIWKKNQNSYAKEFKECHGDTPPEGNLGPWIIYKNLGRYATVIAHDGIDEQMGGYWPHRKYGIGSEHEDKEKQQEEFEYFWSRLAPDHLEILEKTANHFGVKLLFPYLQKELVEYISHIPVEERATKETGKVIMRALAEKYLWKPIGERAKFGFGQALEDEKFINETLKAQFKKY